MRNVLPILVFSAAAGVNAAPLGNFFDPISSFFRRAFISDKHIPFSQFLSDTKTATYDKYAKTNVTDAAAFKEMQNHILRMYSGVKDPAKITSFELNNTFGDCIPVLEQASVYLLKLDSIASPPAGTNGTANEIIGEDPAKGAPSILSLKLSDRFGNKVTCYKGQTPMQRLTLESLTRFHNLTAFFSKPHDQSDATDKGKLRKRDAPHSYAIAADYVSNFGGNSWLNLWNPKAHFSISQHWYATSNPHQTVEGGWTVNHERWDSQARLFIFWTPDDYATGCWNLECPGFVQINNNWYLGGPWTHYSTYGGQQWGFEMQWKLYKGNWWLFLRGPGAYEAVGYYPASIYNNGPITKKAERAKWGGEVAKDGDGVFGEMGSGHFPAEGFGKAAYQKKIFRIPKDESGGYGVWASVASVVVSRAKCYDIKVTPSSSGGSWGSYFYFGGTGGKDCA